jgi:hypothetical protein
MTTVDTVTDAAIDHVLDAIEFDAALRILVQAILRLRAELRGAAR